MIREDNRFIQRTNDGYFNASVLLQEYNSISNKNPLTLSAYKINKTTQDFIKQLELEGILNPYISTRGRYGGIWMHPKLFIDFAMWVSVEFKSLVIDYVLEGLVESRHDAGDLFNEMKATILSTYVDFYGRKPSPFIYIRESSLIKGILGLDNKDRNEMTKKELDSITQLQKLNIMLLKEKAGKVKRVKLLELQSRLINV